MFKYELGANVRDKITGFEGKITSQTIFINGCISYGVESLQDGDIKAWNLDEERIDYVSSGTPIVAQASGGPHSPPPSAGR